MDGHALTHICIPGPGVSIWKSSYGGKLEDNFLHPTQYFPTPSSSFFLLPAPRSINLQVPFVQGSLSSETTPNICADPPDPQPVGHSIGKSGPEGVFL